LDSRESTTRFPRVWQDGQRIDYAAIFPTVMLEVASVRCPIVLRARKRTRAKSGDFSGNFTARFRGN